MSIQQNIYPYTFYVDYSSGLKVTVFDNVDPENDFTVRAYIKKTKINSKLKWSFTSAGGNHIEEETINSEDFLIEWGTHVLKSNHYYIYHYRGFVPYYIEITDNKTQEIVHKESFDTRHKLVNFTLHSDDPIILHTWMCVIENFKKDNECQISITNNYLKENQKYDFVDCYWSVEENFERFYAGYDIGRFGTEDVPHLFMNPDGIQGKNDLEIIEDILYHYSKKL
jgi:hypothetical protein